MSFLVEFGEYQGNAMIKLLRVEGDDRPMQFGIGKAKQLIESMTEIIEFIESGDDPAEKRDFKKEGSKYPLEITREQAKLFMDRLESVQKWIEEQAGKGPAAYSGVPSGKFTGIKVTKLKEASGSLKGFAQLCVGGVMMVKGFRIVEGRHGNFVSVPQRMKKMNSEDENAQQEYEDIAWPVSKEVRAELEQLILDEYAKAAT